MAAKRRNNDVVWPREDFIGLLAQLDLIVAGPKKSFTDSDAHLHQRNVLAELKKTLKNRYTTSQIQKKLWDEFSPGYKYPDDNFPRLFMLGSTQICTLDEETKLFVQQEQENIRLLTPRGRRAKSVCLTNSVQQRKFQVSSSPSIRPRKKWRANARLSTPSPKKNMTPMNERNTKSTPRRPGPRPESILPSTEGHLGTPLRIDRRSRATSRSTRSCDPKSFEKTAASLRVTIKQLDDDERTVVLEEDSPTPNLAYPTRNEGTHEDCVLDIEYYRNRCQKAEEKYNNLIRDIRQKDSFYELTRAIPADMLMEVEKKNSTIANLKRQINNQAYLKTYLGLGSISGPSQNSAGLYDAFTELKRQSVSLLVIDGFRMLPADSIFGQSTDMDNLLFNLLGGHLESRITDDVPVNVMVQALTGAAVHDWVFHQDIPGVAMTTTPLLQQYREHIKTLCGEGALDNLDIAVHQSVIEGEHFKNVATPRIASRHAERLANALYSLINDKRRFQTTAILRQCLERIFSLAIRIRYLASLSDAYESTWPSCHECFNSQYMETEVPAPVDPDTRVKLPLVPGFRTRVEKGQLVDSEESLGFDKMSSNQTVVVKALVLI